MQFAWVTVSKGAAKVDINESRHDLHGSFFEREAVNSLRHVLKVMFFGVVLNGSADVGSL